ncbi:MAG: hypothetical protein ACD_84C00042G0006 [uncultured bacterium]|nr:MAG: hypothetical protein ACD_84C00042G0006 [uncultured bacterium]
MAEEIVELKAYQSYKVGDMVVYTDGNELFVRSGTSVYRMVNIGINKLHIACHDSVPRAYSGREGIIVHN